RRIPGLVWIKCVHVEEERLTTVIFLQPLGGGPHGLRTKVVLFDFTVRDVAQILGDDLLTAPELIRIAREADLGWLRFPSIVFVASIDLYEIKVALIVIVGAKRMRGVGNQGRVNTGTAQDVLKGNCISVQLRPRLESKRVSSGEDIVTGWYRRERAKIGVLEPDSGPRESAQTRRLNPGASVAVQRIPPHGIRDDKDNIAVLV